MTDTTLGVLHPGEMGSSVAAAAKSRGTRVVWAADGRSDASRARAEAEQLEDVGDLARLLAVSDVVCAVCPPHAALDQAHAVARLAYEGVYIDANAVAPETSREIGRVVEAAGATFVDGGIIGPPARRAGSTRLYLSGERAESVAALFRESALDAITLDGPAGAASALKVCFAAYTKGSTALLTAIRALAIHEGVDDALVGEWSTSLPDISARSEGGARGVARKAWRFAGEMEEIAATFASAGLPDGFHRSAADLYERLACYKDSKEPPTLDEIARVLLGD